MRDYTKYDAWNDEIEISIKAYERTAHFSSRKKFAISSQQGKLVVSISSNFVEVSSRLSEFAKLVGKCSTQLNILKNRSK